MNEILRMMNALTADELASLLTRGSIILEKKRKEEAEAALREKERLRQQKLAEEQQRQREIAELQRRLQTLQNQKVDIPEVRGSNFVMNEAPRPAPRPAQAPQPAPAKQHVAPTLVCHHCRAHNPMGSQFCSTCGHRITAAPAQQAAPQAVPQPAPQAAPAPRAQASTAQVRYADESEKKWILRQGEKSVYGPAEIFFIEAKNVPKGAYRMEVTNQRILLSRESSASKNIGMVARMGGGLVGSLIAEGVKAASGAGPKPWLEIPLTAIKNCGVRGKKEFFIEADQTYVIKNNNYEKFLPNLVTAVKNGGAH